ncbi:MAG: GFA family protein [Stellaceae bacterium]
MERLAHCHCGLLRATTSGEPLVVAICHCKACQRRTGALAGSVAAFEQAQVTIEGDTKIFDRIAESGRKVRFYFCPNCGTSLYWEADARPGLYILAVGAFADPNFPAPSVSIFEETKHTWMQLPDGVKHFEGAIIASN